jgi:hypothetical protein
MCHDVIIILRFNALRVIKSKISDCPGYPDPTPVQFRSVSHRILAIACPQVAGIFQDPDDCLNIGGIDRHPTTIASLSVFTSTSGAKREVILPLSTDPPPSGDGLRTFAGRSRDGDEESGMRGSEVPASRELPARDGVDVNG